ncbi:MAD2L1-binding protein [Cephus cinctus]|uniref:MAD2L1-binding protein n=1 Tax=Cephus cinctus TaxID=211228 RepID=A0AAJ7VWS6_CEPCN|nr:MAD2L1-binding protein [Cephus cinctus]
MYPKIKISEVDVSVKLEEPLTSGSCSKLITELIKYLLYQKQQIPFSCESLTQLQAKAKPNDRNSWSAKAVLNSLRNMSDQLTSQLHLEGCNVKEVVIAMGATVVSPKFCVRVELPAGILSSQNHLDYQHPPRKPLLTLMRSMFENTEFQEAISVPLAPTNTFVLLHKKDYNMVSQFFLPKPQYMLPERIANRLCIKLDHINEIPSDCNCTTLVKVHHDSFNANYVEDSIKDSLDLSKHCTADIPYQWYQSKEVIKGFKFVR